MNVVVMMKFRALSETVATQGLTSQSAAFKLTNSVFKSTKKTMHVGGIF